MKKIRIILLAAAVLLLALPPVFGMLTESQVRAQTERLRAEGRLLVTIEGYDRGWFSSRARLLIERPPTTDPAGLALSLLAEPMEVDVNFNHGPVSVQDGFFVGFSELHARPAAGESSDAAGDAPPLAFDFQGQSTFGGALHFAAEIMPFDTVTALASFQFSGGRAHGTLTNRHVRAWVDVDALQYVRGAITFSLLGLRATADNEIGSSSRFVMPGALTAEIDRMSLDLGTGPASTVFDLRSLHFESSTALDEQRENLGGAVRLAVERMQVGADTEITDGVLESAAERLDVAALEAYSAAAARAAEQPDGAPTFLSQVEPAVLRLLAGAPELQVRTLRFAMNNAPFEASLRIAADPEALPPSGAAQLDDPRLWYSVLDGNLELTIAQTLAERIAVTVMKSQIGGRVMAGESIPGQSLEALAEAQAGLAIAVLAAQGFLEERGGLYRTEVRLDDGELAVNGRSLPFVLQ